MEEVSKNQFRINNYVYDIEIEANRIIPSGDFIDIEGELFPVIINHDELLKLGFKFIKSRYIYSIRLKGTSTYLEIMTGLGYDNDIFLNDKLCGKFRISSDKKITKYIYQIQNIYFDLCGYELIPII